MEVVHPVCAGLDIHKDSVTAALLTRDDRQERFVTRRRFSTMTADLLQLADWLREHHCKVVGMESTGVYWKCIYNILQDECEIYLVNPAQIKQLQGQKTDIKDSERIAQLLELGLLQKSFIPPQEIRDLRDYTRRRRTLMQNRTDEKNRVQKILEDANLKLGSVASDPFGVSGRRILQAIADGQTDAAILAEMACGKLREKSEDLQRALTGMIRPHHRHMLKDLLEHIDFLTRSIEKYEKTIEELCRPFLEQVDLLKTIPGVSRVAAAEIIAEIGVRMEQFPTAKHLCSWAGIAPGNHESAGKRSHVGITAGNKWLKAILIQSAHAAARKKDSYLRAQYFRFARKKGRKHAATVVAHTILEDIYYILRDKQPYMDLGYDFYDRRTTDKQIAYHLDKLRTLGVEVITQPATAPAAT